MSHLIGSVDPYYNDFTLHHNTQTERDYDVLTHCAREGARAHDDGPSHWYDTNCVLCTVMGTGLGQATLGTVV